MTTEAPSVGQTIWSQIPIGVKMSLGARQAQTLDNGLTFLVGPGNPRRRIDIRLNGSDTYEIQCVRYSRRRSQPIEVVDASRYDVYAEDLGHVLLAIESEVWG